MAEYVDIISNMNLNDPNLRPNDGAFQTIDQGTYDFEITKQVTAVSGAGNNTLKVTVKVVGPEDSKMLNRSMTGSLVLNDSDFARSRMLNFLQATQCQIDQNGAFSRESLIGLRFTADVETRPSKVIDKMGNEVEKPFTSWVRERPIGGADVISVGGAPTAPAKTAAPTTTGNAPKRPAAPPTNGTARQ